MDLVSTTTLLTQGGRGGQIQSEDGSFKLKAVLDTPEAA
jgi:osmotically inducible protein OsmC